MRDRIYLTSVKRFGLFKKWEEYIVGLIINVLGLLIINVLGLIREEPGPWRGSKLMVESQEHSLYFCEGRRNTCIKFLLSSKLGDWHTCTLLLSKLESLSPEDVSCQVRLKFAHVEKSSILPIISPWKHFFHSVCLILEATERDFIRLCLLLPPRWRRGRAFASLAGEQGSIPGRDRPKS